MTLSPSISINSRAVYDKMLSPCTVALLRQASSAQEEDSFHVLSEEIEKLDKTFFATAAGPDLAFLNITCKQYGIDILEVKTVC